MAQNINQLLEKTTDFDKDERYMATSDLCAELQRDVKIDATLERRVCAAVLRQLDDKSNDVQAIAVKCLAILFKRVQQEQILDFADKLITLVLTGDETLRDVYAIGLRTLVSDVPDEMGPAVAGVLVSRLEGGVQSDTEPVKLECLDVLTELLARFGREVENEHEGVMQAVLSQLAAPRTVVRKKATACLGSVAVVVNDGLLNRLVETLLSQIEAPRDGQDVRALIQTIGTISRTVGFRLGRHLDRIVPLFLQCCGDPEDEATQTEAVDELRENCLQSFESFVLRCPREVTPHLDPVVAVAQQFLRYDPNYSYGDSDEDEAGEDGEEEDEYEDEYSDDDGDFSDDDDTSWKVRLGAAKVLTAVIRARPEMLNSLYSQLGADLIGRFKEREERVRLDVLSCFTELLRATLVVETRRSGAASAAAGAPTLRRQRSAVALLDDLVQPIVVACNKHLAAGKNAKTSSAVFLLLRQLVLVSPGALAPHLEATMPNVTKSLEDRNSALKLDALQFLRELLRNHDAAALRPFVGTLVPHVVACAAEDWYKIIADALRLVGDLVCVMRPEGTETDFDASPFVTPLFEAVFARLEAHDIDQEIKECAIRSAGLLVAHCGDLVADRLPAVLPLLMDRLRNEVTRTATLKTLAAIANSPHNVELGAILNDAVIELYGFLRQQSRALKQVTLETFHDLVVAHGAAIDDGELRNALHEAARLVSDADLHLAHLSLRLAVSVLGACPAAADTVRDDILPAALALAASPLLQGLALESLLGLFAAVAASGAPGLGFDDLLAALMGINAGSKQATGNTARCVAELCATATTSDAQRQATTQRFIADVRAASSGPDHLLALLCLGEIGRKTDLSGTADVQDALLSSFDAAGEDIKAAAAYALGSVAVGSMTTFLPVLLEALNAGRHEYLLLSSVKEVISAHSGSQGLDLHEYVAQLLPILNAHCESREEGVRNMVAECLGKLCAVDADALLPQIDALAAAEGELSRWTAATAVRYCVLAPQRVPGLPSRMEGFLGLLRDDSWDVRRAALLTLNAAAHDQPALVQGLLTDLVLPVLTETVALKNVREVDLGPFKHKVDDGLPLRKAAFACFDTLLDALPERMDVANLMPQLVLGLNDQDDVAMQAHQLVSKVAEFAPGAVIGSLDDVAEGLDKVVNKKIKEGQVGPEAERIFDLIRSALRAVDVLSRLPDVDQNRRYQDLLERINKKDLIRPMFEAIQAERR